MNTENRISFRQLGRTVFVEAFGTAALTFPAIACRGGGSGYFSAFFYGVFLLVFTALFYYFGSQTREAGYVERMGKGICLLYSVRFFINAAALVSFFAETMQTVYMPGASYDMILLPWLLLLFYTQQTDFEKRTRFLELIFPWIITIFFLCVLLALPGVLEGGETGGVAKIFFMPRRAVQNGFLLFLCSSPVEFLLFLKPGGKGKGVVSGVAGCFFCNLVFLFLCIQILGQTLSASSPWPVIKMMQLIRLPGGFLDRFDILPVVFWILCIAGVSGGYLFYGKAILEEGFLKNRKKRKIQIQVVCIAGMLFLFFIALAVRKYPVLWNYYFFYKIWVDFPLSLLVPLFTVGKKHFKKIKRAGSLFVCLFLVTFFSCSCGRLTDVEEKSYILSLYVDWDKKNPDEYTFYAARADLGKMEEKEEEIPCEIRKIRAGSLNEMEKKYKKTVPGELEWNHIYTIFLGPGIASQKKVLFHFLKEWDGEWQKSPNVLLVLCPDMPKQIYRVKNIPAGAAGQEVSLLAEQKKKEAKGKICETPVDFLRAKEQGRQIFLYRISLENGKITLSEGKI